MNASLRGKRVVITGGSSGIGLACAEAFVRAGASVCIIARRAKRIKAAVAGLSAIARESSPAVAVNTERVVGYSADVAQYRQLKSAYRKCRRDLGVPHIWVNCAGFARTGGFEELALGHFYRQIETNYYGALHGVKAVLPDWPGRDAGFRAIVNVASLAADPGIPGFSAYGPSQFALRGFSDNLRQELKRHRIRMHVVCMSVAAAPGSRSRLKSTSVESAALSETENRTAAATVATSILRGLRRDRFLIFPDFESRWRYWISRWFPGLSRRLMIRTTSRIQ